MLAGFYYMTDDCMVIMDADLQAPPGLITEMLGYWEEGYDDVYAKRNHRGKDLRARFFVKKPSSTTLTINEGGEPFAVLWRDSVRYLVMKKTSGYEDGALIDIKIDE